jgi:hypothetical protein
MSRSGSIAASAGQVPSGLARTSRQISIAIVAGVLVNGQIQPGEFSITQSGSRFYVLGASAPIEIQPQRGGSLGASNTFGVGQGMPVADTFDGLVIRNKTLFPVVALIWVGFDDFINDQLILQSSSYAQVAYPTYPIANAASVVDVKDLSGQSFADINGKLWGALSRVCILVFNVDAGLTINLQKANATTSTGAAVGTCFPLTPTRFDFAGDYRFQLGGANINLIVSEIYNAIPL